MTAETPVQFQPQTMDESIPDPVAASHIIRDEFYHPVIRGAVDMDNRVTTLLNTGWCFFPPHEITLDPNSNPPVRPQAATKYVDIKSRDTTSELLTVHIDLQWNISVDSNTPLLVVPWTGGIQEEIASQLITADDGRVPLKAPIATREPMSIDNQRPLVQVIPIPDALLDADWETGTPPDDFDIESQ